MRNDGNHSCCFLVTRKIHSSGKGRQSNSVIFFLSKTTSIINRSVKLIKEPDRHCLASYFCANAVHASTWNRTKLYHLCSNIFPKVIISQEMREKFLKQNTLTSIFSHSVFLFFPPYFHLFVLFCQCLEISAILTRCKGRQKERSRKRTKKKKNKNIIVHQWKWRK